MNVFFHNDSRAPRTASPRHPEEPKATKDLLRGEGERPRSKSLRVAAEEIPRFARNDESGKRKRSSAHGLAASALSLALALCLLLGVGVAGAIVGDADEGPLRSSDASTLGIFVENGLTPDEMAEAGLQGNDSNLGIYVTSALATDLTVEFYSQGRPVYQTLSVGYGSTVARPADPAWDWSLADPAIDPDVGVRFEGWCVETSPGSREPGPSYDFASPVTRDLVLVAAWGFGDPVEVRLHANAEGAVLEGADEGGVLVVTRSPGLPYRDLPEPSLDGHGFTGWYTKNGVDSGDWGQRVEESTLVPADMEAVDLWARWEPNTFWVRYINNPEMKGGGAQLEDVEVVYGSGTKALFWDEAVAKNASFYVPAGKVFDGWDVKPDGTDGSGRRVEEGADVSRVTERVEYVPLYAQWVDDEALKGPFKVTFDFGHDGKVVEKTVEERGGKVDDPDGALRAPKRSGYQFAGWFTAEGDPWSLDYPVLRSMALTARWDLRLDVTVPVEVGFAVDAESHKVTTPGAGRYALRSRTVVPVEVERLEAISRPDELDGFFRLKEDPSTGAGEAASWADPLADTELWLWASDAAPMGTNYMAAPDEAAKEAGYGVALPLAEDESSYRQEQGGDGEYLTDPSGAPVMAWVNGTDIEGSQKDHFKLDAFSYAGVVFDESWQGSRWNDRTLPLKLGLGIPESLEVRLDLDGPKPITRLRVTVSAQG